MAEYVDIVFDRPLGHESGRFVEVELPSGESVCVGEWLKRDHGYWALRIRAGEVERAACQMADPETAPAPEEEQEQFDVAMLAAQAAALNDLSNSLSGTVRQIADQLKRLNFGTPVWCLLLDGYGEARCDLGYDKTSNVWGICIRKLGVNGAIQQQWAFADAPRALRIIAVRRLPFLLKGLVEEAERLSSEIENANSDALSILDLLRGVQ